MPATILLVDSDLIDRADWQALLQFHGYKVHAASNGRAALNCFSALHPDLVLIDSALADITIEEVCRQLKADPQIGDTPIVVSSYLRRLGDWRNHDGHVGGVSTSPATRTQALDRIQTLLSGQQLRLFGESAENVDGCPACGRRRTPEGSAQYDG